MSEKRYIVLRCDFTGIAEVEIDSIFAEIKPILKSKGYNKFLNEYSTELDFQLDDPKFIETSNTPIKERRQLEVYVFINETYQIILDTDAYVYEEEQIYELLSSKDTMIDMNDTLFIIYKDAITSEFIKQLLTLSRKKFMTPAIQYLPTAYILRTNYCLVPAHRAFLPQ